MKILYQFNSDILNEISWLQDNSMRMSVRQNPDNLKSNFILRSSKDGALWYYVIANDNLLEGL